jgi:hypothetical protein
MDSVVLKFQRYSGNDALVDVVFILRMKMKSQGAKSGR